MCAVEPLQIAGQRGAPTVWRSITEVTDEAVVLGADVFSVNQNLRSSEITPSLLWLDDVKQEIIATVIAYTRYLFDLGVTAAGDWEYRY